MTSSFRAETFRHARKAADGRLEMTFADRDGAEFVLSLPHGVAADLAEVFEQAEKDAASASRVRQFKHVTSWSVGRTDCPAAVLVRLNNAPFRKMSALDAMNLAHLLQEAGEMVLAEGNLKVQ